MNTDQIITVLEAAHMEIQSLRKENAELKKASSETPEDTTEVAKEENIGYVLPEEKNSDPIASSKKNSYANVDEAAEDAARAFLNDLKK